VYLVLILSNFAATQALNALFFYFMSTSPTTNITSSAFDWDNSPPLDIYSAAFLEEKLADTLGEEVFRSNGLIPKWSKHRLSEVFDSWKSEVNRNARSDFTKPTTPNGCKCAAFLGYWMCHFMPIIDLGMTEEFGRSLEMLEIDSHYRSAISGSKTEWDSAFATPAIQHRLKASNIGNANAWQVLERHRFLLDFANEYAGLMFAISLAGEFSKKVRVLPNYFEQNEMTYVLKYKNVSPHSFYLMLLLLVNQRR
jgi:hypothetical protein